MVGFRMGIPQPRIFAVIIGGVIGIIVLANAAGVWFLTRGANDGIKTYAPAMFLICVITPLLSAAAAFFAAMLLKRPREKLKKNPFDLHALFTECRSLTAAKAAEKGIILHFYAEPAIRKKPLGDPDRLRQALVNLLSNAIKYTNTGMVKLHSAIKDTRKKTVVISFEVKDSGVGMTGEQIAKLLAADKFETKELVEMMGGKLVVESTPGLGSKFSFDLTFDTIDAFGGAGAGGENIIDEFEMPMFEGEILLCEDNAMNQQIVCEHLARVGIKTVVADNGKIGVETVRDRVKNGKKPFDLIFMDIHMPVMDGLEAAAEILELNTGIPVVAMTANIMSNDLEIYRMSGMYDFVGKPFTSQQLWRCLSRYLKPCSRQTPGQSISAETHRIQVENNLRQKIVIHFVKDNQNKFAEITDAISSGDIKLAHRLAHTLKGSAAQAGKILLQQAALAVEQHLKDGRNLVTPQQMAALEAELNAALTELALLAQGFSFTEKRI
jgi:CheY-like chemotaxis protein